MVKIRENLPYAALAGFMLFNILLAAAITSKPDFALFSNYLSDLGSPESQSAIYFNSACVLAGVAVAAAFYFLGKQPIGMLSGVALALVGFFPTGNDFHFIVSVSFFALSALAVLLASLKNMKEKGWKNAVALLGALHVLLSLSFAFAEAAQLSAPLFETIAVFSFQAWMLAAVFKK